LEQGADSQPRRAAEQVSLIFNGARPGDMRVEEPSVFQLVVN
jgi:hypothetical protein